MKKFLSIALIAAMALTMLTACDSASSAETEAAATEAAAAADSGETAETAAEAGGDYKIGIITGTVSQGEEEYQMATQLKEKYGDMIVTATYPDNFSTETEQTINVATSMAADPDVKVIVWVQAVPGATAAIERVRETRPDILFICGVCAEDPGVIADAADICLLVDELSMGRTVPEQAKKQGAKTFVHISFERHLGYATIGARRDLMKQTCEEIGLEFVDATAPDPTGDAGVTGAQAWITENIKVYVDQYGKDTAFFSTNCSMMTPLIQQCAELGAIFPQQCCPSPYHGYPSAFNISTEGHEGDVQYMLDQIEAAVTEAGNNGRMSTWQVPINMLMIEAGVEYGIKYCEGEVTPDEGSTYNEEALFEEIKKIGGEETQISNYSDSNGELDNFYLILCPFYDF